jgi:maleylacetate reductase
MVFIPTTLSAGEYHSHAGCLDREAGVKIQFSYPEMAPKWIICDAELVSHTPTSVWLSTGILDEIHLTLGIRAVDHACESLCSIISHGAKYDTFSLEGLKLLLPGLLEVKESPTLEAYAKCQRGAWNAIKPCIAEPEPVQLGASHAIGHKLGGLYKVDHGVTSCVMLPAVMQWNVQMNKDRQQRIVNVFHETGLDKVLEEKGLGGSGSAAGLLRGFIRLLGMPGRLSEVGVGREKWDLLAEETMNDPWTHTNPRKVYGPKDLQEIFELAA